MLVEASVRSLTGTSTPEQVERSCSRRRRKGFVYTGWHWLDKSPPRGNCRSCSSSKFGNGYNLAPLTEQVPFEKLEVWSVGLEDSQVKIWTVDGIKSDRFGAIGNKVGATRIDLSDRIQVVCSDSR